MSENQVQREVLRAKKSMGWHGATRVPFLVIDDGDGIRLPEDQIDTIVLTLNSHAALLAACKELLDVVAIQNGNLHDDTNQIQDRARSAISLAEKGDSHP